MTTLHPERKLRRKVFDVRGNPLIVELTPEGIWLREPRRRVKYLLPYGLAHTVAARAFVDAEKRRKQRERAAKRAARRG